MKTALIALLALGMCLPLVGADKDKRAAGKEVTKKAYDEARYADAVALFAAELAKEEAKPKPDWQWLSYYNSYLGLAHRRAGQYDKALEFHHKKLAIDLKHRGKDHPNVASAYHNIGTVHLDKAEYDKALEFYQKSLAIRLVKLGKDHTSVAETYSNIGTVHLNKAEYDKALVFLHKSLDIFLKKLGKDHTSVATVYYNMANIYGNKKNVIKEKELLRKAYAIQLKKLGKDHPDTKKTRAALFGP